MRMAFIPLTSSPHHHSLSGFHRTPLTCTSNSTPSSSSSTSRRPLSQPITADSFRHPIDIRATRLLKSLFPIEFLLRNILSIAEYSFYLDNLSSGVLITSTQLPHIHSLLTSACNSLNLKTIPELYIRSNPNPNAYTLAFQGRRPSIVLHSSLIDILSETELQAVLAHELGHLKCEHGVWISMANLLVLITESVGFNMVFIERVKSAVSQWVRSAELSCDRAALIVVKDPMVVVGVMMKLSGGAGGSGVVGKLDVKEYLKQVELYEKESKSTLGWMYRRSMNEGMSTHPLPVQRVKELIKYSESKEYKALLNE
eukprot:CAMPEP_0182446150 /NCGR_PEP_ID=MMETSP1172-20130603/4018_1 /TAXON_ID=708627 /ORGANISM="Timspurckia oligopyrenoides, Strain CCMP3278" /LENGTH=312 /DNA_ID=CAMNT_0024642035 /DNA_START=56 /DNA_END=994 /DNA_ORIENTATION=+